MKLQVKKISFSYPTAAATATATVPAALKNISFNLEKNTILGIAGESGSGKSTLLNAIYGLIDLNEGEILFNDKKVTGPAFNLIPGQSGMRYAGQKVNLQSSVSIFEQVKYKLIRYVTKYKEQKALELLNLVGLESKKDCFPNQLSGGQQQLVNLCCALAEEPQLLLLDEPFNNLDQNAKSNLKNYLLHLRKTLSLSIIIVSHDPIDLLSVSDEILVLQKGKIIQQDNPKKIFFQPKNKYVAQLFGEINSILKKGKKILVRPSEISISTEKKSGFIVGEIISKTFHGSYFVYRIKTKSHKELFAASNQDILPTKIWVKA